MTRNNITLRDVSNWLSYLDEPLYSINYDGKGFNTEIDLEAILLDMLYDLYAEYANIKGFNILDTCEWINKMHYKIKGDGTFIEGCKYVKSPLTDFIEIILPIFPYFSIFADESLSAEENIAVLSYLLCNFAILPRYSTYQSSFGGIYPFSYASYSFDVKSEPSMQIIMRLGLNVFNYIRKNKDTYKNYSELNTPNNHDTYYLLIDCIAYISNILTCLNTSEHLKYDYNTTYLESEGLTQILTGKCMIVPITAEIVEDFHKEVKTIQTLYQDRFNVSSLGFLIRDYFNKRYSYASRVLAEMTNVILEYLPVIQADIAYIRTTYPDIPDAEEAKSLEKILYSTIDNVNENVNQTRDDVNIANGTTAQQIVQRILTGSAWASAYKQYVDPVRYTEIADAIKRRIFKEAF